MRDDRYNWLLVHVVNVIEKIAREKKEELYRKYFSLPPGSKITRFAFVRKIRGGKYIYFKYKEGNGVEKHFYVGKVESARANVVRLIEKKAEEFRKSLVSEFLKDVEFLFMRRNGRSGEEGIREESSQGNS